MSFKGLIADMDLDTVDLTEDEEKSSQNTLKNRVKLGNEIKTESETIELDSSSDSVNEQNGDQLVNESQAEISWSLLEIESDKEEEKNGNLIENNNSESSQNESDLNLNLEGKEDNNNVNVLSLDSNVSTVENVDLRFILINREKDAKSEKVKDKYANEDLVSDLGGNYEYEDSEGLVENNDVVSVENEKGETAEKALDFEISENKGQSDQLMQGEKLDLKGFYANSEIEGQNEKTGLELVLVSETEGNENENHELEKMDLDLVSNEGNENQELEKIEGQNENMDLDSEDLVENNDVIFENDKGKNPKKSLDFEISENKGQNENVLGEKLDLKRFYANSEIEGQNAKTGLEMVLVSEIEGNKNQESETIEAQNKKMDLELVLVGNEGNENRESEIIEGQNEKMDFDLDLPLVCLKKYKRKKGKSENTNDKTERNANFSSALVLYSQNENLNKRKRKKSIYLSPPFISTIKTPKMGSLFTGEDLKIVPTGEEQNNNKTKINKFIENVLFNLNSAARNPGNPKLTESANFKSFRDFIAKFRNSTDKGYNTIHSEPAALLLKFTTTPSKKDLIAKFTKYGVLIGTETSHENNTASVVFARKKDAESAYQALNGSGEFMNIRLRCLPAELASPPPAVLSEVREKVAGIVERLNGSGLDLEMDLVGDAKGLLAKLNYVMSKDCCVNNNKAIIKV